MKLNGYRIYVFGREVDWKKDCTAVPVQLPCRAERYARQACGTRKTHAKPACRQSGSSFRDPSSLDDISAYQHHCSKTRTVNVKNKKIENYTNMSNPLSCIVDSIVDTLSFNMPASSGASKRRTLKVSGLGHSITLETEPSDTIGDLKQEIESQTSIPAIYQRLLARGKKLEDDTLLLEEAGLEHRTKVMLLHNPSYVQEKEGYETLSRLAKDIDDLESKKDETPNKLMSEFVTRICCKLDAVEIKGSEDLRAFRKTLLRKAQGIDSTQ
jgi:hypothetical protein